MNFSRGDIRNLYLVLKNPLTRKDEALLLTFPACLAHNTYERLLVWILVFAYMWLKMWTELQHLGVPGISSGSENSFQSLDYVMLKWNLAIKEVCGIQLFDQVIYYILSLVCCLFVCVCWFLFLAFLQGKKVDGSVNAYAINVSQKRKYRYA